MSLQTGRLVSETGDVQRSILVAVMFRAALAAHPSPDRKSLSTFWAAEASALRTGLRCIGFIDLDIRYPCGIAFIPEVVPQHRPSSIENALCHRGLCEFRGRHVAHRDGAGTVDPCPRKLVEAVLPPIGDLGVDRPDLSLAPLALRFGQLWLQIAVEGRPLQFGTV